MPALYVIKGPMEGQIFDLPRETTFVGRSPDNHIQIKDGSISRKHLKITEKGERFLVQDLESYNGTFVDGELIEPGRPVEVEPGVPLTIGDTLISLGELYEPEPGMTQYALDLLGDTGESRQSLLHRDRRITNRKNLELIYEVSTLLMQTLDIREICETILDNLFDCLKRIDTGAILLKDRETGELQEVIARSRGGKKDVKMNYSRTIVDRVMAEGKAVIMSDTGREPAVSLSDSIKMMRVKSVMCVPLITGSLIRGALYLHSVNVPKGFRKDDLFLLTGLSTPAALAIENGLLYQRHKQTEAALKESETKYRHLVENAEDAIFIAQDEVVKFPNPKAEELLGYPTEELISLPFTHFIHPADRDWVLETRRKRLRGEDVPRTYTVRLINKSGEEVLVQINASRIQWEGRPATLNFARDVTDQKRFEAQVLQSQKMEAVGTLAGGVAHDFNNLLMGIQGNASLLILDKDTTDPDYDRLKNIERYVQEGAHLTRRLLAFGKGDKYQIGTASINEIVKVTADIFGRTRKEIRIHETLQEDLWQAKVDRGQIEQILLNLLVNAWQAMPEGGDLYLGTENAVAHEKDAEEMSTAPGQYAKITVRDTGVGMDEATRQRVFEPFFTTREIGRGTGLGLASAYGVVRNHGGTILVESRKGQGTTFSIWLPASEEKPADERKPSTGPVLTGKGTLLLVDDEDMILDVGKEMLERLGYKVLEARSGPEALETYGQHQGEISMVILDMVMPGMGGRETFDRLKAIDPQVKVLLSSGYSFDEQADGILERGCEGFIQKPFNIADLSHKVKDILEASGVS